jgi:hypothetical protein
MARFFKDLLMRFNIRKMEEMHLDVKVRLLNRATKEPITGEGFLVQFFDKDEFDVDFLGEGPLDENGVADIRFAPEAMQQGEEKWGDEFETKPDLFFRLLKNGQVVFTSEVWDDVDFDQYASFDVKEGKEIDFGTFLININ